jgi:hypothetical protein
MTERKAKASSNPVKIKPKMKELDTKVNLNYTLSSKLEGLDKTSISKIKSIYAPIIKEAPESSVKSHYSNIREYLTNKLKTQQAQSIIDSNRKLHDQDEGFAVSVKYLHYLSIVL